MFHLQSPSFGVAVPEGLARLFDGQFGGEEIVEVMSPEELRYGFHISMNWEEGL